MECCVDCVFSTVVKGSMAQPQRPKGGDLYAAMINQYMRVAPFTFHKVGVYEPIVINGLINPYKWPKLHGFSWGYFTLLIGVIIPNSYLVFGPSLQVV